ncbi:hypothetical protein PHMEG_00018269 [Phytophthora megakarya]|uniref:Reverse transcriptase n=1 Tax=Phytophthora megakarya TaxID=4795 RepID=A0A225VV94_9STRA|nr:hypothetical protein PHMEG_00018269 [Phytophthora megakarya]
MAEYLGTNNVFQAALDIGATHLVIQSSSHYPTHRHRKRVSVKYLHAVLEYNASADSLTTEALENKASNVISDEPRLTELRSLNRIQEVIYAPIREPSADEPSVSIAQAQVQTRHLPHMEPSWLSGTVPEPRRKNCFNLLQARSKPKRVRFADETSVTGGEDVTQREEADCVPTEDSVRQETELSRVPVPNGNTPALPDAEDVDPLTIQRERRRRFATAQDEDLRWANLKIVLRGEESTLTYRAARDAWKMSDHFVLCEDNVLYYVGKRPLRSDQPQEDAMLRLVVLSTMIPEVFQNCHDALEGGHQGIARTFYKVKLDYYWIGLYVDVARHVRSCPDCGSSKSRPTTRGYSPGNILAERPFQVVSMDFVIALPKSRRGNTALLLFQCAFTGYVMGKAMTDTTALRVSQPFEECVYRMFGAPSLIRHDRDPRFISEVFQSFTEMMQSRSRLTLSYRPKPMSSKSARLRPSCNQCACTRKFHCNKTGIAEKLIFAINNSMDTTTKETPFFLVHEWDAQSPLKLMSSSLKRGLGRQLHEVMNGAVTEDSDANATGATRSLFEVGGRVWLYMERGKPGLTKKLAHRWHGPFRIKKKVEEFAYELELPDRGGYRFYPVVHVSRLKMVDEFGDRPSTCLTQDVDEATRQEFDEELLPEDSREPDHVAGEFEVEAILDDRTPLSTSTERAVREFKVKWVNYDDPTWEPASNLSCGGLLYDYLREKRRARRLQMVQVADDD